MEDGRVRADGGWAMGQEQFPYPGAVYSPHGNRGPPSKDVSASYDPLGSAQAPPSKDMSAIPGMSSFKTGHGISGRKEGFPPYMGQGHFYGTQSQGNGPVVPGYNVPSQSPVLPKPEASGMMPPRWNQYDAGTSAGNDRKSDSQNPVEKNQAYLEKNFERPGEAVYNKVLKSNGESVKLKMAASHTQDFPSYSFERNKMSPSSAQGLMNIHNQSNNHLPSSYHRNMYAEKSDTVSRSGVMTPNGFDKNLYSYPGPCPKYGEHISPEFPFNSAKPLMNGMSDKLHKKPLESPTLDGHKSRPHVGMGYPNPFYPASPYVDPFLMKNYKTDFFNHKPKNSVKLENNSDPMNPKPKKRKLKLAGDNVGLFPKKKKPKAINKEKITPPQLPSIDQCLGAELGVGEQSRNTEGLSPEIDDLINSIKPSPKDTHMAPHNSGDSIYMNSNNSVENSGKNGKSVSFAGNSDPFNFNESSKSVENTSDSKYEQGRSTPCCNNCEKLGMRFSPLCSNKFRTVSSPVLSSGSVSTTGTHCSSVQSHFSPTCTVTSSSVSSSNICSVSQDSTSIKGTIHNQNVQRLDQNHLTPDEKVMSYSLGPLGNVGKDTGIKEETPAWETKPELNKRDLVSKEAEKENLGDISSSSTQGNGHCLNGAINPSLYDENNPFYCEGSESKPHDAKLAEAAWAAEHVQKLKDTILGNSVPEPEESLIERLKKNIKIEIPRCSCKGVDYIPSEEEEGPYYTQLGAGRSIQAIRELMEKRTGVSGKAIRMEKIRYTGREGKSTQGCPIAKWIIRRSGEDEKYLCVVKQRSGHFCDTAFIIVVIVAWEGVPAQTADTTYDYLVSALTKYGFETERRCGTNDRKTCACQGIDLRRRGASFSFGCSWSMYFNGCKFARSREARKFKLKDTSQETDMEDRLQNLATKVAPLYKQIAPDACNNQTQFEDMALDCRLGKEKGRPFSGVTACVDFCAHAHKDLHNMNNGSTVVLTLTKHRGLSKPDDEQLHVLPLYVMDLEDEHGNREAQLQKIENGSLEVLQVYPMEMRVRSCPLTPSRKKKGKKDKNSPGPGRKRGPKSASSSEPSTPQSQGKDPLHGPGQESNNSLSNMYFNSHNSQTSDQRNGIAPQIEAQEKGRAKPPGQQPRDLLSGKTFISYEDMMSLSSEPGFANLYESFWNYFYSYGTFPPPSFLNAWNISKDKVPQTDKCMPSHNTQSYGADGRVDPNPTSGQQTVQALDLSNSGSQQELDAAFRDMKQEGQLSGQGLGKSPITARRDFESPLHLLSEAVTMRTKMLDSDTDHRPSMQCPNSTGSFPSKLPQNNQPKGENSITPQAEHFQSHQPLPYINQQHSKMAGSGQDFVPPPNNMAGSSNMLGGFPSQFQTQENPNSAVLDPTVVKCEMEYNENAFTDPNIGGVAIALSHGAVLFEVAKRELHATTGLRNPDRFSPTRISLVFYQHKNLNFAHHGWFEYERKMEGMRQKRLEKLKEEATGIPHNLPEHSEKNGTAVNGKKKKGKKSEKVDIMETSAAQYKYMWEVPAVRAESLTTDSVITRWIDPQPMVTGPYQRWV